jgi:excisionase family DNA binding protein
MSIAEAATYIGRTPTALRHMIAGGAIPVVREGARIHLDRGDLDRWIEMRKVQR